MFTSDIVLRDYISQITSVKFIQVDKITLKGAHVEDQNYASLFTKIAIFSLVQFDRIIYYDLDFVFQSNPITAYAACAGSIICACRDGGMTQSWLIDSHLDDVLTPNNYFNAGFIVLKPNEYIYDELIAAVNSEVKTVQTYKFAEQDLFNVYFKGKWKELDSSYNLMHVQHISASAVAIHEKLWILQEKFKGLTYVWNDVGIPRISRENLP